ncbi:hypothetical protein [Pedobacter sp. JCM 36344]|uniref:hypothetical protein n=1 Tax=Pedobacter sp. JCM 36344 TaxID=3374280 RepID=UPI00397CEEB1
MDIDDIPFDLQETTSPAAGTVMPDKFRKLYESLDNPDNSDDLILKYIQCIFTIWEAATQKNNFTVQKYAIYIYTNWVYILERLSSDAIDFQQILKFFLRELGSLNISLLELESKKQNPLLSTLNYGILLNKIFSDDVKFENLDMYFQFLFNNLYQAARLERYNVVDQFIERCINSNFDPLNFGAYSHLYNLLDKKLKENSIDNNQALLKKVPELGFYKIRYLKNFKEYEEWVTSFENYLENEIFTKIETDDEIYNLINNQKKLALKSLKYNLLQIVVLKVLTFSLFKSTDTNIRHAFNFNQPEDSSAIQGNKEIMPTTLSEILNYVDYSYNIEHDLFSYWEGHHGVEFYLHKLFIYIFYRYNPKKHYYDEDPARLTKAFCSDVLLNDPARVDGLIHKIQRLESTFKYLLTNGTEKISLFDSEERVVKTKKLFGDVIGSAKEVIQQAEINTNIKEERKTWFLQNVIQEYDKYNFLLKLFKLYGTDKKEAEKKDEYFGINELMDRSAFLENWHIPFVGLIESFGKTIAERENRLGITALYETIKDENSESIDMEKAIAKIIRNINDNNIIVGKNIYFHSLFIGDDKFVEATSETVLIKNCHVGFYNEIPIFNFYDNIFRDKSFLVIDKRDICGVVESTVNNPDLITLDSFSTNFSDYLEDAGKFSELIDNPNSWLVDELGEEKEVIRNYLKKFVWIRILKGSDFIVSGEKRGMSYNIQ